MLLCLLNYKFNNLIHENGSYLRKLFPTFKLIWIRREVYNLNVELTFSDYLIVVNNFVWKSFLPELINDYLPSELIPISLVNYLTVPFSRHPFVIQFPLALLFRSEPNTIKL